MMGTEGGEKRVWAAAKERAGSIDCAGGWHAVENRQERVKKDAQGKGPHTQDLRTAIGRGRG